MFLGSAVLALSLVPMAGALGYFSSLLLAPVLSVLAAAAGVDAVLEARRSEHGSGPDALWTAAALAGRDLAWLVGLTYGILFVGQLWTTNCDVWGGSLYFGMGPAISGLLSVVAGICGAVVVGDRRRLAALVAGWIPFAFCLFVGVRRLYVHPVVFAFDPFWGWYTGPLYDEAIAIGDRYYQFRAYNLTVAAGAWLLLRATVSAKLDLRGGSWRRALAEAPDRLRAVVAALLLFAGSAIGLTGDRWGFTATIESITAVLSASYETEHFVIHYAPASVTALEIEAVAAEHEFAYARLESRLNSAPRRKVHSFIFANGKLRQRLVGADRVEVSPPWRQQMYLSHRTFPHKVMHHELGHSFMGDFGDPVFGVALKGLKFNGGLVEGLPTALAPRSLDHLGLHEQAAILDRLDKRPPLQTVMGVGFWSLASTRAYTAAGSFVRWLAEVYDTDKGWRGPTDLYDNAGDFEAVYGVGLAELERQWLAWLRATVPLRDEDIAAQAQRFQRQSVFRRPCAHRAAELKIRAARARLRRDKGEALEALQTLCTIEPDQPAHFMGLATLLAQWGEFDEAAEVLDELAAWDNLTATYAARIEEQRGDTALMGGDLEAAQTHYEAALEYGMIEVTRRTIQIKLEAARAPKLAPLVAAYFDPFEPDTQTRVDIMLPMWTALEIRELDGREALGNYLLGRQFLNSAAPEQAYQVLDRALEQTIGDRGLWTPELRRAAQWSITSAALQTRRWDEARAALDVLEQDALGQGHLDDVALWRERVDFFEAWFAERDRP